MSTTAPEYLATLRDGATEAVQQWMDQSTNAWDQWSRAWTSAEGMATWLAPARGGTSAPPAEGHGRRDHCSHGHDCEGHGHEHGCRGGHDHGGHDRGRTDHGGRDRGRTDHGGREHGTGERGSWRQERADGCGCGARTSGCGCGAQEAGCGCGDPCRCCVPAADVIVHARVGEVRVVPFHLRNPWRRERPVSLEVGPWHGCEGDSLTVRAVLEEESIVLAPCEDRVVRLLVAVRPARTDTTDDGNPDGNSDGNSDGTDPKGATKTAAAAASRDEALKAGAAGLDAIRGDDQGRVIGDVEGCATVYADVRFEGCARPQRVALVVLPAECDAVDVACDCGCCC